MARANTFRRSLRAERLEDRLALTLLTVNSLADHAVNLTDGTVTLRDAIYAANNNRQVSPGGPSGSGADEIGFQPGLSGVITLHQGQLVIRSDLTITGPGANLLAVSGNNAGDRVFEVTDVAATVRTVIISGLTITEGIAPSSYGSPQYGGGILNEETLTVLNCVISGNSGHNAGGGIHNMSTGVLTVQSSDIVDNFSFYGGGIGNAGTATVQNSTISGNLGFSGGGIRNTGTATVQHSTVSGNEVFFSGGGISNSTNNFSPQGTVTLTLLNSTVSNNSAVHGAGILNERTFSIQDSTISDNSAYSDGGGMKIEGTGATATIISSTFARNEANDGGAISSLGSLRVTNSTISANRARQFGGGLLVAGGTAVLTHDTITNNTANTDSLGDGSGSGMFSVGSADVILSHTIVADNFRLPAFLADDISGTVNLASAFNLIGYGGSGGLTDGVNGNKVGVSNPLLGPLTNNGGPTQTHALLPGSPAIDAGSPNFLPPPHSDQRGAPYLRVAGGRIDIGAVELQSNAVYGDFNNDGLYDGFDIDALVAAIAAGTHQPQFDLTGDALVNLADRDAWLTEAGGINLGPGQVYRHGDANLDGVVDGSDFGIWNANKFTSVAAWTRGDFNADSLVDGSDFGILNANKFTSSSIQFRMPYDAAMVADRLA
jgi:hypothetical protein